MGTMTVHHQITMIDDKATSKETLLCKKTEKIIEIKGMHNNDKDCHVSGTALLLILTIKVKMKSRHLILNTKLNCMQTIQALLYTVRARI